VTSVWDPTNFQFSVYPRDSVPLFSQRNSSNHCDLLFFAPALDLVYVSSPKTNAHPQLLGCPQFAKNPHTDSHLRPTAIAPQAPRHPGKHRHAGRLVLHASHYCIGCDGPQTNLSRPTPTFYASRGPGTLSVQACEVSSVSSARTQHQLSSRASTPTNILTLRRPR
jgi:hypothetical protein